MKICLRCLEGGKEWRDKCMKCGSEELKEIDELMIPIFIILKNKGYKPVICYSGHLYTLYSEDLSSKIKIILEDTIDKIDVPEHFLKKTNEHFTIIEKDINYLPKITSDEIISIENKEIIKKYELIKEDIDTLINWALNLEEKKSK